MNGYAGDAASRWRCVGFRPTTPFWIGSFVSRLRSGSWPALLVAIVLVLSGVGSIAAAQTQSLESRVGDSIVLENEFIAIIVNARDEDTGRFSVNTTGGDPERAGDENRPLVFGTEQSPGPWTSYTTVRVDGRDYVFGGATGKRAGFRGTYVDMEGRPFIHEDREIRTVWRVDDIVVTQVLGIAAGVTTGQPDTARIEYRVVNEGTTPRSVGLRIMLDTLLGRNDGAPFQVGGEAVVTDTAFTDGSIPDYYQAFDSLANPRVVSQGTLRAFDTTVPDAVYFSNWGSLADGVWDFDFRPGRDFARAGEEFEQDSAVALFWNERPLAPGEARSYVTYYGLGGITIAPGHLSLGVTSPASLEGSHTDDVVFEVRAYIENTGEWIARDTVVRLENLAPLRIAGGSASVNMGDLAPREARQVNWRVVVPPGTSGDFTYRVAVSSSNADANRVDRTVTVVSPASLEAVVRDVELSVVDGQWHPVPLMVETSITNTGQLDAHDVEATVTMPIGLDFARGEGLTKRIGPVRAGETVTVGWHLAPTGVVGNLPVSLRLSSSNARIGRLPTAFVAVPRLDAALSITVGDEGESEAVFDVGDMFNVSVHAENVRAFYGAALEMHFDPTVLQVLGGRLGVDRGRAFVSVDPVTGHQQPLDWRRPVVDNEHGVVRVAGSRGSGDAIDLLTDSLATIRFRAVAPGTASLRLVIVRDHPYLAPDAQAAFIAATDGTAVDVVTTAATVVVRENDR